MSIIINVYMLLVIFMHILINLYLIAIEFHFLTWNTDYGIRLWVIKSNIALSI